MRRTHFLNGKPLKTEEEILERKKAYGKKYWETYKRKPYTPEQKERQRLYMKKWWKEKGNDLRRESRRASKENSQLPETD